MLRQLRDQQLGFVSQSKSEAAAIRRIFQGEPEAYRVIIERYQPLVYAVALACTGNLDMTDKVVVETFEEGYGRLVALTEPGKLGFLLCSIAEKYAEQFTFKRIPNWNKPRFRESSENAVDLSWVQTELIEPLNEELGSFTSQEKQGILLNAFCGLNAAQIAQVLKIDKKEAAEDLARTRENVEKALLKEVVKALKHEVNNKERLLSIAGRIGGPEVAAQMADKTKLGKAKVKLLPLFLTVVALFVVGISGLFIYQVVQRMPGTTGDVQQAVVQQESEGAEAAPADEGRKTPAPPPSNYAIKGRVVDERFSTDGIAGITVETSGQKAETDFYGAFEIRGIARGEHAVTLRVGDRVVKKDVRLNTEKENAPIDIRLDDNIPARFHFHGRAFDRQTGRALTEFEVAACKDFPEMLQPYVIEKLFIPQKQSEGMIHERFVALGDYTVYVRARGYAPLPVEFSIDEKWDGQQIYDFPLYRATGLKAVVYGSNELSLEGAYFIPRYGTQRGVAMDKVDYGRTNSMGRLELYTLPVGIQSFYIAHQEETARAIVDLEPGKIQEIVVEFPRKGALTGDITLFGRPTKFNDFRRQATGSMLDLSKNLNYNAPGQYEITLTPEPVFICGTVTPSGPAQWFSWSMKKHVTINASAVTWLDFNFNSGSAVLNGNINLSNTSNRVVYAEVSLNHEEGTDSIYYNLSGPGSFQLTDINYGSGSLTIYAASQRQNASDFETARGLMDKQTKTFELSDKKKSAYLDFTL